MSNVKKIPNWLQKTTAGLSIAKKIGYGYSLAIGIAVFGTAIGLFIGDYYNRQAQTQLSIATEQQHLLKQLENAVLKVQTHPQELVTVLDSSLKFDYETGKFITNVKQVKDLLSELDTFIETHPTELATELDQIQAMSRSYSETIEAYTVLIKSLWGQVNPSNAGFQNISAAQQGVVAAIAEGKAVEIRFRFERLSERLVRIVQAAERQQNQANEKLMEASALRLRIIMSSMALSVAIAVVLALRTSRAIARPVEAVTKVAQQVTQESNFDLRATVQTSDEMEVLAHSLNQLIEWVGEYTQKLELARQTLEQRVEERTFELQETLERLKATQQGLIQSEKMAALGQLVAGVAHEVNTPLGAIRSSVENIANFLSQNLSHLPDFFQTLSPERRQDFLQLLQKPADQSTAFTNKEKRKFKRQLTRQLESQKIENADTVADTLVDIGVYDSLELFLPLLNDPNNKDILDIAYQFSSLQKSTQTIKTATDRAAKVVFALKTYARYDSKGDKTEANILDGIETVLTLYHNQIKKGVEVLRNYMDLPSILCYPDELNQVWTNLIHNALHAMDYKGTLIIDATANQKNILIQIVDNGVGISPEIQPRIFEPFFTTKPPGEGSGLGLDIARKIVEKHEGTIAAASVPGKTTFTVSLPIEQKEKNWRRIKDQLKP